MNPTVREPAVAGTFYPADAASLRRDVERHLREADGGTTRPRLLFAPHAGYRYSGAIAGAGYGCISVPPLVVVLAPNHYGIGAPLALPRRGAWRTPLGDVSIDEDATAAIAARLPAFRDDWRAHSRDHALEVQLPFLQVRAAQADAGFRVVTLSVGTHDLEALLAAGAALASGLSDVGRGGADAALLVVSSDMSHYIPAAEARRLDMPVLERVQRVEPEAVHAAVHAQGLTVCGVAPAVLGLAAARALGAGPGRLVRYGHSGEVTGKDDDVVAYASVLVPPAA